ncbi:MAG: hypothetical protein KJO18_08990 [Acidimicrobiia bacterium]|nr:hypothetical protein [Acidimicrobiia bacterium]
MNGLCSMPVVHVLVSADHAVGAGEGAEQWPQVYAELLSEFAASTAQ